jgi:ribosome-associated protein
MKLNDMKFEKEMYFKASKSSGRGGQNVNKVSTKIGLFFNVNNSALLSEEEKLQLKARLKNKIDKHGFLGISSQTERSQLLNKKKAIVKFYDMLSIALKKRKKRVETKPTLNSVTKRLSEKKIISGKKSLRKKEYYEE